MTKFWIVYLKGVHHDLQNLSDVIMQKYKSTATIKSVIYILTGKLDFANINPACATHSLL